MTKDRLIQTGYALSMTEHEDGKRETNLDMTQDELKSILNSDPTPDQKFALINPGNLPESKTPILSEDRAMKTI